MIEKFGRKFELVIYPAQYLHSNPADPDGSFTFEDFGFAQTITISNPFTLIFNIHRKSLSSMNTGSFQIYNLGETTRNLLYKDYTNLLCLRRMTLKAGYSDPLPVVFDGNIKWCTSYRTAGQNNFVTEIEAYDWAFPVVNSHTSQSFPGTVKKQEVVDKLVKDITSMGTSEHHVERGFIHQYDKTDVQYNRVLSGYTWDILKDETDSSCFIDNGKLNILSEDECFSGGLAEISSKTGLLGSPKRSETYVCAEMLFEPTLAVGQQIRLNSSSQKIFNENYKIFAINHSGTISDAVGGRCQTSVSLFSFKKNAQLISPVVSLI